MLIYSFTEGYVLELFHISATAFLAYLWVTFEPFPPAPRFYAKRNESSADSSVIVSVGEVLI